jgi:hypothetical protein
VRRFLAGLTAFLAMTGVFVILPVYAAPAPAPRPVETSIEEIALGSVVEPEGDAVVTTDGEPEPGGVDGEAETGSTPASPSTPAPEPAEDPDVATSGQEVPEVPALTVSRPDTDPFSTVGVTWRDDPAVTDVVVQLRVKDTEDTWGEWTSLLPDDIEQTVTDETADHDVRGGTAPYWTGDSRGIELIVQGANGAVPEDVQVTLLDPGSSPADTHPVAAAPTGQAHAGTAMPDIVSRAGWGADESIRTWGPEYAPTIKAATIHHTADSNNYSAADVPAIMRSIYTYHTVTRGWGDIGYNVIVDKFGRIFEGRYGGLTSTVIGAHAGGFNTGTFGVSMLGNYDVADTPAAVLESVSAVIAWKLDIYGVNPRGTTQLTSGGGGTSRYAAGVVVTLPTVFGHRDVGSTACPGKYAYARMDQFRAMVAAKMGPGPGTPVGNVESLSVTGNRLDLSGWAYDPDNPSGPIDVGVSINDNWSLSLRADRSRPDVGAAYPAAGAAHGFTGSTTLPTGKNRVCVVFVNVGSGANAWSRCQLVTATNPAVAKNPVGNLETATVDQSTLRVSGWTVDPDALNSSLEVHVYVNGQFSQAVTANGRRDDIAAAFPGAGSAHGWTWQKTMNAPGSYVVCAYAINLNVGTTNPMLNCTTLVVASAVFEPQGHLDEARVSGRTVTVTGWAVDRDTPTQSLEVHVYADGRYVRALTADQSRPDVGAVMPAAGAAHGYTGSIDLGPGTHNVCTYALNAGLGTTNPNLGCAPVTIAASAWDPFGNLEEARTVGGGQVQVTGWVWDPDSGTSASPVHIYVDGQYRAQLTAGGSRADIAAAFPAAGAGHGFQTRLSIASGTHNVCAFGINVGRGQSNPLLACQQVTV